MTNSVVIGAGMAGLTVAAYLARDGMDVDVYEQSDFIGGVTMSMKEKGFTWDIGPMIIEAVGPGEPGGVVLKEIGAADRFKLIMGDRVVAFPDYTVRKPEKYSGPYWRKDLLKEIFPDEADGIDRFYNICDIVTDLVTLDRMAKVRGPVRAFFYKIGMLILYLRIKKYEKLSAKELLDLYFTDEKIKAFFTAILADLVVLPSEFIGLGVPFFNPETAYDYRIPAKRVFGIGPKRVQFYYVAGGIGKMVDAVAKSVTEAGGKIHTNKAVKKILTEGEKVTGVELENGKVVEADMVFVSGGARECFLKLIGKDRLPTDFAAKIEDVPLMESVFMVQLGVDMDPTPYQDRPVVYYINTYDIEGGVYLTRDGEYHEGKEGFVVYINSFHTPEMAPKGMHSITIYTIAPSEIEGGWEAVKDEMTEKLLVEVEKTIPGLRKSVKVKITLTPDDFKRITYMPDHHSFGGMCPIMGKEAPKFRTPFKNLWFIGSQSEAGASVPAQIINAKRIFKMAKREV
ncbi:MAG: NAD(P)/FAD-dependent oxidoreductase [Deltaproteobacteria bacterium]|uniref:NAD(P)/FAD-dependent oxidoreductase n=1 Tax=Candidatus Zymogenus saltonus TaxID=2844893 RepID=A0A9D8KJ03_9DELT|nr:NAD(P)/FAD-dependent oxidoreductase [Candidatus Zymogenus saltonus]